MTTLSVMNPTIADMAKLHDPDGNVSQIAEILDQQNEIIQDVTMQEGNLQTGHQVTVRTGIPLPTWRKMYGFVAPNKSRVAKVVSNCGMLQARSMIDKKEADLNDNKRAWRMSEDYGHIEGINQEFAGTLIYGNEGTAPEEFTGLAAHYNNLTDESSDNIIDAFSGSGGDLTSIYLLGWSPRTAFCFSPKGGASGLKMEDKGEQTLTDANGGRMDAYETVYSWDVGFCLRDWRFGGRIANIDISDLATIANAQKLIGYMIDLEERIPNLGGARFAWYMSRTLRTYLRQAILASVSSQLTYDTVAGKRVLAFDGIPVRRVDQITHTETRVVA